MAVNQNERLLAANTAHYSARGSAEMAQSNYQILQTANGGSLPKIWSFVWIFSPAGFRTKVRSCRIVSLKLPKLPIMSDNAPHAEIVWVAHFCAQDLTEIMCLSLELYH